MNVTIVDYKVGNIGSLISMLSRLNIKAKASSDSDYILNSSAIILPGVGAYDRAMNSLKKLNLIKVLNECVYDKNIPILGICLGAQILGKSSEEGDEKGLGFIDMDVIKFQNKNLSVPHMGWNYVKPTRKSKIFKNLDSERRFYFVHSYYFKPKDKNNIESFSNYGDDFVSAVSKNNVYGVQFHPEKSHRFGLQLLKDFFYE
tara:strand:- start:9682 stop:10287 length:606 start_codon:yes stop_codon:yes gene_type:complete